MNKEPKNLDELLENLSIPHETLVHIKLQIHTLLQRWIDYYKEKNWNVADVLKSLGGGMFD